MKRHKRTWVIALVVLAALGLCGICGLIALLGAPRGPRVPLGAQGVAIIPIKGTILAGSGGLPMSTPSLAYSDRIIQDIQRAEEDPAVAAIVLEINSPGGSVVGSVDIYHAVRAARKPVVASIGEMGASGGYYIACGADRIVVRPGSITGSIGVIMEMLDASQLASKLGVTLEVIKTGPYKDQGSWHRPLTAEERALLQAMLDEAYEDFIQAVVQGRGLAEDQVRAVADGRILSGRQAVRLGLADREGDLQEAVNLAAELAGLSGAPEEIRYERQPGVLELLLGSLWQARQTDLALLREILTAGRSPVMQYLYIAP